MVDIACEVQRSAPADPLLPANAVIQSSYTVAMDTVSAPILLTWEHFSDHRYHCPADPFGGDIPGLSGIVKKAKGLSVAHIDERVPSCTALAAWR